MILFFDIRNCPTTFFDISIYTSLVTNAFFCFDENFKINYIDSEDLQKETPKNLLSDCDGILVPGGFGNRGFEGKISAIKYVKPLEEKVIPEVIGALRESFTVPAKL